ncbi:PD-(D/E)XK nuclease family protein [Taylorella equigenitalis]|uniref:PD-(D/E)XK nuclease family protein n=1 Tax=Taylorella equigenitalis TaxID=29575 RepID=UPI0023B180BA|nr:PD-(D/E)XK nuclease family protein [Taylorella equigenitalis]WEE00080.1 PD-(D/E)XK nuclease family protein [Taylorella equigenitalis]WEE01557.1 PD-(D/E)XK nuclease family protein [Taylorella equigenitalis]WFD78094.1 PD-(D/E)XK nuclease family protein [Taylorella equigenitalis]WFD79572.1 PD-(D/E)XK nuclease family protein [Taylorella equigenitalis]WFD81048.1 PD-(D/E)XK nuclease family protein [Taylorella equigenitalis]
MPLSEIQSCTLEELNKLNPKETLILAASNRLTFDVRRQLIDQHKKDDHNKKIFELPSTFTFKRWIKNYLLDLQFEFPNMPVVLNDIAESFYWSKVLDKPSKGAAANRSNFKNRANNSDLSIAQKLINDLIDSNNLTSQIQKQSEEEKFVLPMLSQSKATRLAMKAHKLIHDYSIKVRPLEKTPEYEIFTKWHERYLKVINNKNLCDSVNLEDLVLDSIRGGILKSPKHIILHGFYKITPYMKKFLTLCRDKGSEIHVLYTKRPRAQNISLFSADSIETELKYAIDWASHLMASNPNKRLAIVVPNLQNNLLLIERELANQKHWHISLGRNLDEWSLIRSVICWFELILNFHKQKIPLQLVGNAFLNAEFGFSESERETLAHLDYLLRKRKGKFISHKQLSELMYKHIHKKTETLFNENDDWINAGQKDISHWADAFRITLTEFEFPADAPQNSTNYQLCTALDNVLKTLSSMHQMLPKIDVYEAVDLFKKLLSNTMFQVQREADSKLDIMGLYEVEGGRWDHVWVCGLQSNTLPPSPSYNPLIPLFSQINAGVDLTTWNSTWELSEQIFNGILHTSNDVILSYSDLEENRKIYPSSFLIPYMEKMEVLKPIAIPKRDKAIMQTLDDRDGLTFEDEIKRGGAHMIELQSINPLWNYAKYRLNVDELRPYPKDDYNASIKGDFYHKILELFYKKYRSSSSVTKIEDLSLELDLIIDQSANEVLAHIESVNMQNAIKSAAKAVMVYFIQQEISSRSPFEVVHVEKNEIYTKEYMDINFKVDRVDRVGDKYFIIDYKTGKPLTSTSMKKYWIDRDRLKKCQLPFYACSIEEEISENLIGVSNVFLHQGKLAQGSVLKTYVGFVDDVQSYFNDELNHDVFKFTEADWWDLLKTWKSKINDLLDEIKDGISPNVYIDKEDMKYCEIKPFLRIFESNDEEAKYE